MGPFPSPRSQLMLAMAAAAILFAGGISSLGPQIQSIRASKAVREAQMRQTGHLRPSGTQTDAAVIAQIGATRHASGAAPNAASTAPTSSSGHSSNLAPARFVVESKIGASANQLNDPNAQRFLDEGVWRQDACNIHGNFQRFGLADGTIEVGAGKIGDGEQLRLVGAHVTDNQVEIETQVCAPEPIGCNQTYEVYRILGQNRLQEWHFEGRLPNQPPYVLVDNGIALDGSGPGRVFNRCPQ